MRAQVRFTRGIVGLTVVALPLALLAAAGGAGPAGAVAAACSGVPQDVNGDGFADLAVGEPGSGGGKVHVFYGTPAGLATVATGDAPDDQIFAQGVGGVPGTDTKGDAFGATTLLDDLNDDGCADLAIGVPGNNTRTGAVVVLYGSTTGIRTAGARFLTQASLNPLQPRPQTEDQFGAALAAGDFNGDNLRDLAVGVPFDLPVNFATGFRGTVNVFYGDAAGLGRGLTETLDQDSPRIGGAAEDGDLFGFALASADFNSDGRDDLAVGVPGENSDSGLVHVLYGDRLGFDNRVSSDWSQDKAGVPGVSEAGDDFGWALATGDVNGDGNPDLVVGTPGENKGAGMVTTLLADPVTKRVAATGARSLGQATPNVVGDPGTGDWFGYSLAVGRFDGDAFADLAVGVPNDWIGPLRKVGSVNLFKGSAVGPVASSLASGDYGGGRFSQDTGDVPARRETGDGFGLALQARAIQGPGLDNLVIAAPSEKIGTVAKAGTFVVLSVTSVRPEAAGSQGIDSNTPNVAGAGVTNGQLGWWMG